VIFHAGLGLLAGLEGQWVGELDGDPPQKTADVVNPADMTGAREIFHIERTVGAVAGYAEASGYVLAGIRATLVGIVRKSGRSTGQIDHLALEEGIIEVFREPDGPTISQPFLGSTLGVRVHLNRPRKSHLLWLSRSWHRLVWRTA